MLSPSNNEGNGWWVHFGNIEVQQHHLRIPMITEGVCVCVCLDEVDNERTPNGRKVVCCCVCVFGLLVFAHCMRRFWR